MLPIHYQHSHPYSLYNIVTLTVHMLSNQENNINMKYTQSDIFIEEKNLVQKISSHQNSLTHYTSKEAKLMLSKKVQWKKWRGIVLPEGTSMLLNTGNVTNETTNLLLLWNCTMEGLWIVKWMKKWIYLQKNESWPHFQTLINAT